jgi:hypothetical protein
MKTSAYKDGARSNRSKSSGGRRLAKEAAQDGPILSDLELRALSTQIAERVGANRLILILIKAHDALKAGHIRLAERVLERWRLKSFQRLAGAVIKTARSGKRIEAMNMVFEAELYAYETTLDHARAFLAYRDQLGASPRRRRSPRRENAN